jgi:hypothetical protein
MCRQTQVIVRRQHDDAASGVHDSARMRALNHPQAAT